MTRFVPFALVAAALSMACSSSPSDAGGGTATNQSEARAGEIYANEVWTGQMQLTGTVVIPANVVVELAPGATISCGASTSIVVAGTLKARAAGQHAKISCAKWPGIAVARGGTLDIEGLDLENAAVGLNVSSGSSRFVDGSVMGSVHPFVVGPDAKLEVTRVKASTPASPGASDPPMSQIAGTLVASHLDYDATSNEGIKVLNGGDLDLEDSVIHGTHGNDLVSAYGAKHLKVAYTQLSGSHCGVHIQPAESFEIDHVTSDQNIYGITIYGSGAGPNVVRDSDFTGTGAWLDYQGPNGPISFENVFTSGPEVMNGPDTLTVTRASGPHADAKPRP